LAKAGAGRFGGIIADQRGQQTIHRRFGRGFTHGFAAALFLQPDCFFDQITGNLLDIAPDIADFGELGRFDLDEGGFGELCQPPADLGLAAARRADHQGVLGRHFIAQIRAEPLPPP